MGFLKGIALVLFCSSRAHVSKLFEIIQAHLPDGHCFADDKQLYMSFNPGNPDYQVEALSAIE